MKSNYRFVPGSVVAPEGFHAAGVFCDIKRLGTGKGSNKGSKPDLALIVSSAPAAAAGMFTTNQVCAAPVKLCIERLRRGAARAIVANSGNANACTGGRGLEDALEMARFTELALNLPPGSALPASTGRIGLALPMDNIRAGIVEAGIQLGSTAAHAGRAAEAIMTSDTRSKQVAVEFKLDRKTVRIGGICKGAGMIQPGMSSTGERPAALPLHATMLCFLTTDAAISAPALGRFLREAVAASFNRITVDGDMSTNDTVLLLANGKAGNGRIGAADLPRRSARGRASARPGARGRDAAVFQAALNRVCLELARSIVRDGEGVSRFVTVRVEGARSAAEADAAARAVANSALVKTSWNGGDPNWGRIMDALGYSRATVVENRVDIGYSAPGGKKPLWSLRHGQPTDAGFKALCAAVAPKEFELHIRLNLGKFSALIYAADLTEQYVDFNKGDVSDPGSLGG